MMEDITTQLKALLGSAFNSGPVTEVNIASAEVELGLLFPPSYRSFLGLFGASLSYGFDLYGLPAATDPARPPQWSNVVTSTVRLRPDGLPENSVQISHDGMDHGYFLQCSNTDPLSEGPVIEWGPAHDGGKIIASSFLEFIGKQLGE